LSAPILLPRRGPYHQVFLKQKAGKGICGESLELPIKSVANAFSAPRQIMF
jgi:hypothetical protein